MLTLKDYEVKLIKRRITDAFAMLENKTLTERAFQLGEDDFYPFMCGWFKGELNGIMEILDAAE